MRPARRPALSMSRPRVRAPATWPTLNRPSITPTRLSRWLRSNTVMGANAAKAPAELHSITWAPESSRVLRATRWARLASVTTDELSAATRPFARALLDLEQLLPDRVDHGLHAGVKLKLLQDVPDVVLDGVLRDEELLGDVPVVEAPGYQPEHLHLPVGEARRGDLLSLLGPLGHRSELREELGGHGRGDARLPAPHRADGVGDLLRGDLLQQVARRSGLDGVVQVGLLVADGQHEDLHVGHEFLDLLRGLDPRALGHPDVHEDHVGHELLGLVDGLLAVGCLPDHLDVRLLLQDHLESAPEESVVVDDQDVQALRGLPEPSGGHFVAHVVPLLSETPEDPPVLRDWVISGGILRDSPP